MPNEPTAASADADGVADKAPNADMNIEMQIVSEVQIMDCKSIDEDNISYHGNGEDNGDDNVNGSDDEEVVFAAYRVLETLEQHGWEESRHRFKDYVRAPKPNGYKSIVINCSFYFFPETNHFSTVYHFSLEDGVPFAFKMAATVGT